MGGVVVGNIGIIMYYSCSTETGQTYYPCEQETFIDFKVRLRICLSVYILWKFEKKKKKELERVWSPKVDAGGVIMSFYHC